MGALFKLCLLAASQSQASTGDLKGNCWQQVVQKFLGAELIGMRGGNMSGFSVSGYLIDNRNVPYRFWCHFPYSHGKPERVTSNRFAEGEEDPISFTRKTFERESRLFLDGLGWERSSKKKSEEADELLNAIESK